MNKSSLLKRLQDSLKERITRGCYTSVDTLPILNWVYSHEQNNVRWLLKSDKRKASGFRLLVLLALWNSIYDDYIKRFGFDDNRLRILRKQKEVGRLIVRRWDQDDRSVITFIQIAELELEKMMTPAGENPGRFFDSLPYMEHLLGLPINVNECSVAKYYGYVKLCEQKIKINKAA